MTKTEILASTISSIKNTADAEQFSRRCFNALRTKEITRSDYFDLFDLVYPKVTEKNVLEGHERSSIQNRVDRNRDSQRTLGQFALGIYDNTLRERILIEAWRDRLKQCGQVEDIDIQDHGMSNDGMIHFSKAEVNPKADFKIKTTGSKLKDVPNGEMLVEVKFCPSQKYLHFKESDFRCYAEAGASVLIFIGNDMYGGNGNPKWDMEVADLRLEEWGFIAHDAVQDMLKKEEFITRYNARGQVMMGGKPCVRLNRNQQFPRITQYVYLYNW